MRSLSLPSYGRAPPGKRRSPEVANSPNQPLDLSAQLCKGRSSACAVALDVPKRCAGSSSSCPVAFFLHGGGGNGQRFYSGPTSASNAVHEMGFIGIYPTGEHFAGKNVSGWNNGDKAGNICAWDDFDCYKDPQDMKFFADIIAFTRELGARGHFFSYGVSNGADMSQRLASNAGPELPIAGIWASSTQLLAQPLRSGPAPYNYNQPRDGVSPKVAQAACHGTADPLIPYSGGHTSVHSDDFVLLPEPDSDALWAQHNSCTGSVQKTEVAATSSYTGDTTAIRYSYQGCPPGAPVEFYKVIGAGHGDAQTLFGRQKSHVVLEFFARVDGELAAAVETLTAREEGEPIQV